MPQKNRPQYHLRGPAFTVGGAEFRLGGATKNCYGPHGPKHEKKSPGFDKIIVLIIKDE